MSKIPICWQCMKASQPIEWANQLPTELCFQHAHSFVHNSFVEWLVSDDSMLPALLDPDWRSLHAADPRRQLARSADEEEGEIFAPAFRDVEVFLIKSLKKFGMAVPQVLNTAPYDAVWIGDGSHGLLPVVESAGQAYELLKASDHVRESAVRWRDEGGQPWPASLTLWRHEAQEESAAPTLRAFVRGNRVCAITEVEQPVYPCPSWDTAAKRGLVSDWIGRFWDSQLAGRIEMTACAIDITFTASILLSTAADESEGECADDCVPPSLSGLSARVLAVHALHPSVASPGLFHWREVMGLQEECAEVEEGAGVGEEGDLVAAFRCTQHTCTQILPSTCRGEGGIPLFRTFASVAASERSEAGVSASSVPSFPGAAPAADSFPRLQEPLGMSARLSFSPLAHHGFPDDMVDMASHAAARMVRAMDLMGGARDGEAKELYETAYQGSGMGGGWQAMLECLQQQDLFAEGHDEEEEEEGEGGCRGEA